MMTATLIKSMSPLLNRYVKVENKRYINGGYTGYISAIGTDTLLVEHPEGSNGWEKASDCTLKGDIKA